MKMYMQKLRNYLILAIPALTTRFFLDTVTTFISNSRIDRTQKLHSYVTFWLKKDVHV